MRVTKRAGLWSQVVGSGAMGRQVEDIRVARAANAASTDAGVLGPVQPVMVVSLGAPFGIVGA
jgi:hypothetical protein